VIEIPKGQNGEQNALTAVMPPNATGEEQSQAILAAGGVVSQSATQMDHNAAVEAGSKQNNLNASSREQQDPTLAGNQSNMPTSMISRQQRLSQPVIATLSKSIIRIPAPEIDWSYAVIERLNPTTLKAELLPFNLGKLVLDHDPTQNLELQQGDIVTILNQRDILVPQAEQTKFVRLEGEFPGAGVYSVKPGETLEQLVARAGGLTSNAYLYGSSFQRESTRAFQQQRLDDYIAQLSADMDRQTAVRGASTSTGISDPNALMLERNLVMQLRDLRATGRIVLEFSPDSSNVDAIPHIPLENGDVFRVPARPNTVSVIGAVYGQNVLLYKQDRHVSDYLSLAGGPNRIADKDHAFIVRADGSVYSRMKAKGVFSNRFEESWIYPGDTIVIPEKPIAPSLTKRLLDYSQILSSFGLAVAAINVIR
jgi:protein involved in polysaccharide export with SLBB domain